jgi:GT2 family glycosyltransferase
LDEQDYPTEVIVVDNGSNDGLASYVAEHFSKFELISLPENIGFGAACNVAIGRANEKFRSEYIFLLNNDTVLNSQTLTHLIQAGQGNPTAGIFGPKIYYHDSPNKIWYAGARRRRWVLAAADTGRGLYDRGQFDESRPVDYVFGAAMFLRRSLLERIGPFDERFFLYLEDLDFCLRAHQAGSSSVFVPQAKVWHHGSASTAKQQALRRYHIVKSTVAFLKKHTTLATLVPVITFWSLLSVRMFLADLIRGDFSSIYHHGLGLKNGIIDALCPKVSPVDPEPFTIIPGN